MKKYYQPDLVAKHVPEETISNEKRIQYLRPGQILSELKTMPVAYQPIGTLEWHGRQNPIGVDTFKAESLCIAAAQKTGGLVMPAIWFAADSHFDAGHGIGRGMDAVAGFMLPGSFYQIDNDLLIRMMENACKNYLERGFKMVVIVSGHNATIQGNLMNEVCYNFKTDEGKEPVIFTMEYETIKKGDPRRNSDHAGGYETGMMMHLHPSYVNMRANDNCEIPELAISGGHIPLSESSAEEGRIRFTMQCDGLCTLVQAKYDALN